VLEEVGEEILCSRTLGDSPAMILVPGRVDKGIVEVDNKGVGLLVGCGKGIGQEFVPDRVRHAVACRVVTLLSSADKSCQNVLIGVLLSILDSLLILVGASYSTTEYNVRIGGFIFSR
jgi:hypothetical protein